MVALQKRLGEGARSVGYVSSEEAARDASAFQDAWLGAKAYGQGLESIIGTELMPVVSGAPTQFRGFIASNGGQVSLKALVSEIDRLRRQSENDALFDGATGWGNTPDPK